MANDLTPKIIKILDDPRLTLTGDVERRRRVNYVVGPYGPFSLVILESEFTAARVMAEMEKVAAELRQLPAAS